MKQFARIQNNIIINVEEYSDEFIPTSDTLIELKDYPAGIGDEYKDNKFYRDGKEIDSYLKQLQQENSLLKEALYKERNDNEKYKKLFLKLNLI